MIRCQVLISDSHSIDFRQSVQNSQKWAYRGDSIDFRLSELILTVLISDTIYIYAIGSCNTLLNEREMRLIIAESERLRKEVDTSDNKERRTGQIVHLLPQEKLNIDVIIDVFGLVEKY